MQNELLERAAALIARQLPTGVFFCTATPGAANVMTVGWGGLTYFWKRHVFVAPIRPQRHTYPILQEAGAFTISVPAPGAMLEELSKAGTLCGRDGDKFRAIGLQTEKARQVAAPVIGGCALYLECIVRAQNAFLAAATDQEIIGSAYPAGDFHTLFYGEVVACYEGDRG